MTVAELRKALTGVPDDLVVVANDVGGYPSDEVIARASSNDRRASGIPHGGQTVFQIEG